jgi:hypothetical protein
MNLDDDPGFRFYRKARRLNELLTVWIAKADEVGAAEEILLERDVDGMPPNLVVAIAKNLEIECEALKLRILCAADSLGK